MSALDQVRQAITQKLAMSGFTTTFPDVPIEFPNKPFETPDNKTYIKVSIIHGDSDQAQLAKTREIDRHVGILQFDVISPAESGTKKQNDVADFLGKIYRRQNLPTLNAGTIVFRTPNHLVVGMERGAERMVVRIPFRRDEEFIP